VFQKHATFDDYVELELSITTIFGTLITMDHGQVFLFSHLNYFVHLLFFGKLTRPKNQ